MGSGSDENGVIDQVLIIEYMPLSVMGAYLYKKAINQGTSEEMATIMSVGARFMCIVLNELGIDELFSGIELPDFDADVDAAK